MTNISEQILLEANNKLVHQINSVGRSVFDNELNSVCKTETRLFPSPLLLDKETTEIFRAMCIYSQSIIKSDKIISSHRPVIGRVIVFAKKIVWNLVKPLINDSLLGIQECFSNLVVNQARLSAMILKKTTET